MAGKFNLGELIAEGKVPKLDTNDRREQIEYIHIDRIDGDPNNFYELSRLKELAENIELIGLQQPLRVRANPEDPSRVILVSGHRRRAAIRVLVNDGREDLAEIPCIREQAESSAALQELRLIYANSDTRKMSSADLSKQAERVEILLYQLKEEGYDFPGRMRDHVAEACKPDFIRVHKENCFIRCAREKAEGVAHHGGPFLFVDGTQCHEVDAGDEFLALQAENEALREQLAETDEAAIELYEASLAQEEINAEQDEAIIEIYEAMEVMNNG